MSGSRNWIKLFLPCCLALGACGRALSQTGKVVSPTPARAAIARVEPLELPPTISGPNWIPGPAVETSMPVGRLPASRQVRITERQERNESEPAPAPAPVPTLGPVLSQQEREQFEQELSRSTSRTQRLLAGLRKRSLTAQQQGAVNRVTALLSQAEELRASDLQTARNLAERAELLVNDLARASGIQ